MTQETPETRRRRGGQKGQQQERHQASYDGGQPQCDPRGDGGEHSPEPPRRKNENENERIYAPAPVCCGWSAVSRAGTATTMPALLRPHVPLPNLSPRRVRRGPDSGSSERTHQGQVGGRRGAGRKPITPVPAGPEPLVSAARQPSKVKTTLHSLPCSSVWPLCLNQPDVSRWDVCPHRTLPHTCLHFASC